MKEKLLVAQSVSKTFFRKTRSSAQDIAVVSNVDIGLARGELVELVGRSGSGKSTLLNMVAGLLEPSEGRVLLDGCDIYALDDAERSKLRNARIGVIPQGQTALHNLTVMQNVLLPYCMYEERDEAQAEQKAMGLLRRLDIEELSEAYPKELSGGELRRMAIARALVGNPDVLLADEPTGDLDDENTANVLEMLHETSRNGTAVLLVTHEQEGARYADRIFRMVAGEIEEQKPQSD